MNATHSVMQDCKLIALVSGLIGYLVSHSALAESVTPTNTLTQIGRYSVIASQTTNGQRDPLSVTTTISIPNDIENLGEALRWVIQDSGYRLAADAVLSDEVRAMLELPLPAVHRHFDPLPLKTVISLMVGPAFRLVLDPVHRLIAFEHCSPSPESVATEGER